MSSSLGRPMFTSASSGANELSRGRPYRHSDGPTTTCSQNSKMRSWKPHKVLRTLLGRPIGTPGRFATA
eukprot:3089049-Pyramimonas_sp.AAC.1